MIIAIDGPAASGKTTVAKLLAERLNISYLDTGATYRTLTLAALRDNLDLTDKFALGNLAGRLNFKIEQDRVYLDSQDVSSQIRTPLIDKNISLVVSYPEVREVMVKLQRRLAAKGDFVVEGRDITTVVFPEAEFKFYLDADFSVRWERRFRELKSKSIDIESRELQEDLKKRDIVDKNREVGPLTLSPDAVYIDTTSLNLEETVEKVVGYIQTSAKRIAKN